VSRLRYNWDRARTHLRENCPALRVFIDDFGRERYAVRNTRGVRKGADLFQALARSIAYQQLSGKAAGTIHGRFEALFEDGQPQAAATLKLGEAPLRAVGLSRAKTAAILDLAGREETGRLPSARQLGRMSDEAIIDSLSQVRGIGAWTAQMHLIFYLGRPDVMPATDLAIQKGVMQVYDLADMPRPAEVLAATEHLAPYRSAASWYFWRASEVLLP
jgi:DNA-3-methyladenine glycosylase II